MATTILRQQGPKKGLRIASFLPAATEMVYALGLGDYLVGRTHECDYPPCVQDKAVLVECVLNLEGMTMSEIDKAVSEQLRQGKSLYRVNEEKLRKAEPSLIITQNLCQVCGPAQSEVACSLNALRTSENSPEILWQTPKTFDEVLQAYVELGRRTNRLEIAEKWVRESKGKIAKIAAKTQQITPRKVAFLEWIDPVYCGGHWVPEMLKWAGGVDHNSRDGSDSVRISWDDILAWGPEVILVSPCGFKLAQSLKQTEELMKRPRFKELPAAQTGRIYAIDANSYFARPGIRLVEGVELLAHLIHPEIFPQWHGSADAFARVTFVGTDDGLDDNASSSSADTSGILGSSSRPSSFGSVASIE